MKRLLALFTLLLVILANTNPPKNYYLDYEKQAILGYKPSGLVSIFADPLINVTTTENDLYFCTVYTTHFGNRNAVTVGILGQFIPVK